MAGQSTGEMKSPAPALHIDDTDLERYSLGLVNEEPEPALIEEHLLWCQSCLACAEAVD